MRAGLYWITMVFVLAVRLSFDVVPVDAGRAVLFVAALGFGGLFAEDRARRLGRGEKQ